MSNLLKEAIVDAKALREAALKNAETTIINKYSNEIRDTLEQLLEQDEIPEMEDPLADMDLADPAEMDLADPDAEQEEDIIEDLPLAATDDFGKSDGEGLSGAPAEGEKLEVDIELDALQEMVRSLQGQLDESENFELNEEDILDLLSEEGATSDPDEIFATQEDTPTAPAEESAAAEQAKGLDEDVEIPDDLLTAIMEKLTVDMGADLAGWAGRSSEDVKYEMERELAHRRSTEVEEEIKVLKKAQEELVFENKQLKERLLQYKQATQELKEGLQDVNLSNARLLYTNRVLRNASLNERQKERIVEAISSAGSVTEARTIFDTLQSTVEAKPRKSPQSLNEAITTNRSSVIRASRQESTSSDPFQERMKRLAGIKK
jgi:hypothetical protein